MLFLKNYISTFVKKLIDDGVSDDGIVDTISNELGSDSVALIKQTINTVRSEKNEING